MMAHDISMISPYLICEAFEAWDVNQDGKISKDELERVLAPDSKAVFQMKIAEVMLNPAFTKKDLTKLMKAQPQQHMILHGYDMSLITYKKI